MAPGILSDSVEKDARRDSFDSKTKQRFTKRNYFQTRLPADQKPLSPSILHLDNYDGSDEAEAELINDIINSLKVSGGCIIRNMFEQSTLDTMEKDVRPYLDATGDADAKRDGFVPSQTRMVTGLLSKSRTYATELVGNRIWQRVVEYFLTSTMSNYWHGPQKHTSVSKPQLSTTVTFSVGPGTPAQGLHRDDDIYHIYHPEAPEHHLGRDAMVCFFVAGSKCTKANGATRIVPGSHLWDFSSPPPSDDDPVAFSYAEMQPGDAFMMLGGVFHGAGANVTSDQERLVYACFSTRGYLRQEENQYLANNLTKIKELPLEIQKFAGFGVSQPYMGWVDMEPATKKVLGMTVDEENYW